MERNKGNNKHKNEKFLPFDLCNMQKKQNIKIWSYASFALALFGVTIV